MPPKRTNNKRSTPDSHPEADTQLTDDMPEFVALRAEIKGLYEALELRTLALEQSGGLDLMNAKAELQKDVTDSLPGAIKTILTDKLFMEEFKDTLWPEEYEADDEDSRRRKKPKPSSPAKARNAKLQQLIHYYYHVLLKKPHSRPSHWSLPKVPNLPGSVNHWPRPAAESIAQPFMIPIQDVDADDRLVQSAVKKKADLVWGLVPSAAKARGGIGSIPAGGNDGASESDPNSATDSGSDSVEESDSEVGGDAIRKRRKTAPAVTDSSLSATEVWRPDWNKFGASASINFRARVLELCKQMITASGPNITLTDDQVNEIITEIETYWENVKREYGNQMQASKRLTRKRARARDRRRARLDRLWNERVDKFGNSPLAYLADAEWYRLVFADKHSWLPDLLSEDEEGRFVKRADLHERMVYYLECTRNPRNYQPSEIWESREAFWMTFDCRRAGILLDEYARKVKPSITPVFRTPFNIAHKNLKQNPPWPKIREHDDSWNPDPNGEGFVIYRSMVCHARIREFEGYDNWQKRLYPDPPTIVSNAVDGASGMEIVFPTLQEVCEGTAFKDYDLWNEVKLQYEQVRVKRAKEEDLIKRYKTLTAMASRIPADQNDDDQDFD